MEKEQTKTESGQKAVENVSDKAVKNPFENRQPVEKDIEEAETELENEQSFKEENTERD